MPTKVYYILARESIIICTMPCIVIGIATTRTAFSIYRVNVAYIRYKVLKRAGSGEPKAIYISLAASSTFNGLINLGGI
jgi:hypothetical protein